VTAEIMRTAGRRIQANCCDVSMKSEPPTTAAVSAVAGMSVAVRRRGELRRTARLPFACVRWHPPVRLQLGYSGGSCPRCAVQRPRLAMQLCDYFASAALGEFRASIRPPATAALKVELPSADIP
jgi:hypothetical protein